MESHESQQQHHHKVCVPLFPDVHLLFSFSSRDNIPPIRMKPTKEVVTTTHVENKMVGLSATSAAFTAQLNENVKDDPTARSRHRQQAADNGVVARLDSMEEDVIAVKVEDLASRIVRCIRLFIDVVREEYNNNKMSSSSSTASSFTKARRRTSDTTTTSTISAEEESKQILASKVEIRAVSLQSQPLMTNTDTNDDDDDLRRLYRRMEVRGVTAEVQVILLLEQHQQEEEQHQQNGPQGQNHVIGQIILPLLQSLSRCYDVLDRLPTPPPPPSSVINPIEDQVRGKAAPGPSSSLSSTKSSERKATHKQQKPTPPRGMLSLQDYTDIACLLEFLVCRAILPILEPNILSSIQDRIQYQLPKSLSGRLPRTSLLISVPPPTTTKLTSQSPYTTTVASNDNVHVQFQNQQQLQQQQIQQRRQRQLVDCAITIGDLVLLDRFRPMLLPRHLADVYAALFQAEQQATAAPSSQQQQQSKGSSYHDNDDDDDEDGTTISFLKAMVVVKEFQLDGLYKALGLLQKDDDSPILPSTSNNGGGVSIGIIVPPTLQARAYQTLLLKGVVSSPLWLRRRVSSLLTQLATNHLPSILTVFVPIQSSSSQQPQSELSSSCQRLGRTLMASSTSSPSKSKGTTGHRRQHQQHRKLLHQVLELLPVAFPVEDDTKRTAMATAAARAHPNSNNDRKKSGDIHPAMGEQRISPRSMVIIQTSWAILDNVPNNVLIEENIIQPWIKALTTTSTSRNDDDCVTHSISKQREVKEGGTVWERNVSLPGIRSTVRQIGALCAFIPPSITHLHLRYLPFLLERILESSILSQLIRLACCGKPPTGAPAVVTVIEPATTTTTTSTGDVATCQDAEKVVQWICHGAYTCAQQHQELQQKKKDGKSQNHHGKGTAILAVVEAFVTALAPTNWDLIGNQYQTRRIQSSSSMSESTATNVSSNPSQQLQQEEEVIVYQQDLQGQQSSALLNAGEILEQTSERAQFFVDKVVLVLAPPPPANGTKGTKDGIGLQGLPSQLFRLLLRSYLSGSSSNSPNETARTGGNQSGRFQLVSAAMLPILCEKCSQEQLLFGDEDNGVGLLILIRDVLSHSLSSPGTDDNSRDPATDGIVQSSESHVGDEKRTFNDDLMVDGEMLEQTKLSIASLVMSLLIAVIELGSKLRSHEEESVLQSLLPILQELAVPMDERRARTEEGAAMADMAGYAMALIASRQAATAVMKSSLPHDEGATHPSSSEQSKELKLRMVLREAELDLASSQPPIRARGMVSLGRLARGLAGTLSKENTPPIIQELNEAGEAVEDKDVTSLVSEILNIAIVALSDKESYVYLAAVQSIVALGDLHPHEVLPIVGACVVEGKIFATASSSQAALLARDSIREDAVDTVVSREQRIKLAEALMFIIRRRAVPGEFVPLIVNLMISGTRGSDRISGNPTTIDNEHFATKDGKEIQPLIQEATHEYFVSGNEDENDDDGSPSLTKEQWLEERDIRIKTGGPIYTTEEGDVIRSVRITILAELVSVSSPVSLAPYCAVLLHLAHVALTLDPSRLVSRSAALLSQELYSCLVREAQELEIAISNATTAGVGMGSIRRNYNEVGTIPFAVALICSPNDDESLLAATLRKCCLMETASFSSSLPSDKRQRRRLYDPTTTIRCQEALALRQEAKDAGIFWAAQLVHTEKSKLDELPRILTTITSAQSSSQSQHHASLRRIDLAKTLE